MAERIHGPYAHRNRWRIVGVRADGTRICASYATRPEAEAAKAAALGAISTRTIGSTVTEYLDHLATRRRPSTVRTARYRLVAFFGLDAGDAPLMSLTPARACAYYKARAEKTKPDTHQGELALVRSVMAYAVKHGWLPSDPFASVEPIGSKALGRNKPQLRVTEARRLLETALADSSSEGLAVALALLTGARASEVTDRVVRDVDDGGAILWVSGAKTDNGNRPLMVVHARARERLANLAGGRPPEAPLWGEPRDRHWLAYHVARLCKLAGVPDVGPHGLRRTHATIARLSGVAAEAVAAELGQGGADVTRRSYFAPGTDQAAHAQAVAYRICYGFVQPNEFTGV